MLEKILRHVRKRWQWRRYARRLDRITSMSEYERFLRDTGWELTKVAGGGAQVSERRRRIAESILDSYGRDVDGWRVLDIVAGYGDFLDVARERGAITVGVDHDPFVVRWLQLRGHVAFRCNVLRTMSVLQAQPFEFIYLAGSIVVEYFLLAGLGQLRRFLRRLEEHRAAGGSVLICPYFEVSGSQRVRKIEDPLACSFTNTMRDQGYQVMERLPLLHESVEYPEYPLTYGKLSWATSREKPAS